jgi:hypothetical protein
VHQLDAQIAWINARAELDFFDREADQDFASKLAKGVFAKPALG